MALNGFVLPCPIAFLFVYRNSQTSSALTPSFLSIAYYFSSTSKSRGRLPAEFRRCPPASYAFTSLLLFEQLALTRDVAAVALGQNVLAQRLHVLAGDDVRTDGRPEWKLRTSDGGISVRSRCTSSRPRKTAFERCMIAESGSTLSPLMRDIYTHHVGRTIFLELIVHRCVAAGERLHAVKKSSTISASGRS